ncbi:DUF2924 domain-containing protein [Sulfitobacter mediterraneus]|jgi:Protein of unknown function (DUF2924)|uniref:DUF2924 domain-containing protein n=1 Tax=Sulfitobacter mediterraneus TaxID=83219 RepID=UPI000EA03276|nr:DUF2924 domain-containing protein [Sulfitobacter mediterraneus]
MTRVAAQLDMVQLEEADAAALRRVWTTLRGKEPPRTFTARLMRLALAWDMQAAKSDGETVKARREWNRIIKGRGESGTIKGDGTALPPSISAGTRLLKEWGGTAHEVLVTEGGASWNGQHYSSLSAVARAMTGTNRNGPKFFGLREGAKP